MIARLAFLAAAAVTALTLAGCNPVAGVGRDIEKAGESIQGAAKK